jgi:hypothetical protein
MFVLLLLLLIMPHAFEHHRRHELQFYQGLFLQDVVCTEEHNLVFFYIIKNDRDIIGKLLEPSTKLTAAVETGCIGGSLARLRRRRWPREAAQDRDQVCWSRSGPSC